MKKLLFILSIFITVNSFAQFSNNNPRIFNILNYGAKPDGKQVFDGVTNGTTTITSATANFTSADVGKSIRLPKAGTAGHALVTTIASVTNSTTAVLTVGATGSVTSDTLTYGTDNTKAIDTSIVAAFNAKGGKVFAPSGWYIIAGALQTSVYGSNPNCQIPFPVTSYDSSGAAGDHLAITIEGEFIPNLINEGNQGTVHPVSKFGTVFESIIDGTSSGGVPASVFGTKSPDAGDFNVSAVDLIFSNLTILTPINNENSGTSIGGINGYYASSTKVFNSQIGVDGVMSNGYSVSPNNDVAGVITGREGAEVLHDIDNVFIYGYKYGLVTADHSSVKHVSILHCQFGRVFSQSFDGSHDMADDIQWCPHYYYVPKSAILAGMVQVGGTSPYSYFNVGLADLEVYSGTGNWYDFVDMVNDSSSLGRANIFYSLSQSNVGQTPASQNLFKKQNGDSIYCYNVGKPFPIPISTPIANATAGSIFFAGTGGTLQQKNSDLFYDSANARIGKGTNAPSVAFHIKQGVSGALQSRIQNTTACSTCQADLSILNDALTEFQLGVSSSTKTAYGNLVANSSFIYTAGSAGLHLMVDAAGVIDFATGTAAPAATRMVISSAGAVRMNTYGAGAATFDASGNITSASDERLKNIWGYDKTGLGAIMKINPILFSYNKKSGLEMDSTYAGFSAQNIKANIPFGTGVQSDGYLTLQDRAIMAAMVNAIKEQQKEIEDLKKEIKAIKHK